MSELEQTKKVLDVIANLINKKQTCTYRYLIYDLLGFKEDAYSELISGLTITNFLVYVEELEEEIERLNTNLEVANEDLTRIAQLLNLEEGCTIYDIEDKIGKYKSIIKEVRELRKHLSNKYYELGEEVDIGVIIEHIDRILDKVDKGNNNEDN